MACSNAMSDLAVGKSINDVWQLKPEDIIDYLQTLPDDHHHCAELVVGAMYRALTDLSSDKNKSWMKLYRIQR